MLKRFINLLLILLILIIGTGIAFADQEVTGNEAEQVKNTIDVYVKEDSDLKGSFFVYDAKTNQVLDLRYDHAHEKVKKTDNGKYFACVDFVDANKNTYDLDFYLDKTGSGTWDVDEIVIHKVNGENRLTQ